MTGTEFDVLVAPARALLAKKGEDYRAGVVTLADYFPFQDKSYVQMMYTKTMRLRSLVDSKNSPNFESIKDTTLDLLNYTVFYLSYLESVELKKLQAHSVARQSTLPGIPAESYMGSVK